MKPTNFVDYKSTALVFQVALLKNPQEVLVNISTLLAAYTVLARIEVDKQKIEKLTGRVEVK